MGHGSTLSACPWVCLSAHPSTPSDIEEVRNCHFPQVQVLLRPSGQDALTSPSGT